MTQPDPSSAGSMPPMRYVSTRGAAPELDFAQVLLAGLADDGGLYVPANWPVFAPDLVERVAHMDYVQVATEVLWPYVAGSIDHDRLVTILTEAYATFASDEVVPLFQLDDRLWLAELFHGPTLAFKDIALQPVGRLFDEVLARQDRHVTIVGATSGDTGSAAIEAVRDRDSVEIFMFHPAGRVSEVQRRQMTTVLSANVHNVAIDGTFDDCQDLVKALFADEEFRVRRQLSAVNSINWARVMAQVVYYVWSAGQLCGPGGPAAGSRPSFSVPTGNFGNVFAGWVANRSGLDVERLVVGSNSNDILARWLASGALDMTTVQPTLSPSMDIQVSSNQERLVFELWGRDGARVADAMANLRSQRHLAFDDGVMAEVRSLFDGARIDDDETLAVIADVHTTHGILIDPHTAVGIGAARHCAVPGDGPVVCLATAHPAKFPDAVEQATGIRPALPAHLADLFERDEKFDSLPNDLDVVRRYIDANGR
jgi:threonine synthase